MLMLGAFGVSRNQVQMAGHAQMDQEVISTAQIEYDKLAPATDSGNALPPDSSAENFCGWIRKGLRPKNAGAGYGLTDQKRSVQIIDNGLNFR